MHICDNMMTRSQIFSKRIYTAIFLDNICSQILSLANQVSNFNDDIIVISMAEVHTSQRILFAVNMY